MSEQGNQSGLTAPRACLERSWSRGLIYLALVAVISFLFLLSPAPKSPEDYCGWYVELFPGGGFVVNCDAKSYVLPAQDPSLLWERENMRQARPLYIIVGKALCGLVRWVVPFAVETPCYWGFVALNFLLLLSSLWLFDRVLNAAAVPGALICLLSVVLICNDVTKAFLWTPHQQLLSIFTPLLAVYLSTRIASRGSLAPVRIALVSLGTGTLCLAYGNFLIILPCLWFSYGYRYRREGSWSYRTLALTGTMITVLFLSPTLIWMGVVTRVTGHYYNHEVEVYRQLIWIVDSLRIGVFPFAVNLARNTGRFLASFLSPDILPFLALAAGFMAYSHGKGKFSRANQKADDDPARLPRAAAIFTFVMFLGFFWLLGYYHARLTFTLTPLLMIVIALELNRRASSSATARKAILGASTVLALLWCGYHIAKYGPFS